MSIFSDLLGKHIAAKAIKSNEMAQFCGIERSFMYKIIKGTRHVAKHGHRSSDGRVSAAHPFRTE